MALAPTLTALSSGSRSGADVRTVEGIAAVIDELKPGVTVSLWYSSLDISGDVHLSSHSVSIPDGNGSISQDVRWQLPAMALYPGKAYAATLHGVFVEVTSSGGG